MKSLHTEIENRKSEINEDIHTIYFGGGTPSVLSKLEIQEIMNSVRTHYKCDNLQEVTLEANPDDLTMDKLIELKEAGINRLSIGIQSFFEEDLKWMNRSHNAEQAKQCIHNARKVGFEKLTIDLIYGYPLLTNEKWQSNLQIFKELDIPHLSAYSMTVEEDTALDYFIKKGKEKPIDDGSAAIHFQYLMDFIEQNGYQHYEISNFSKPHSEAIHNSNYWKGISYLGFGPSAHSFNGIQRRWNVANMKRYIDGVHLDAYFDYEVLSLSERYNEYVMTRLRTQWGVDVSEVRELFGEEFKRFFEVNIAPIVSEGDVMLNQQNQYVLSRSGKLKADLIASDLFWVNDSI